MGEEAMWDAWARGEARCPYCINMGWDEFQAMCDCSRAHFEATGRQSYLGVISQPEVIVPIMPLQKDADEIQPFLELEGP